MRYFLSCELNVFVASYQIINANNETLMCLCGTISSGLLQQDLHERIDRTRYTDPLEDSCFQYGFNSTYLKTVVSYWRQTFDWKKQVRVLNQYPHFKTKIEGTHNPELKLQVLLPINQTSWPTFGPHVRVLFYFHTNYFVSMQGWMCTTSMCDQHTVRTRRFCLLCWFTAGRAPSMSSTRFCPFSQRTRMV